MKALKIILWGVNLLFTSYLVNSFMTTAYIQDKDYQGVEKGNEMMSKMITIIENKEKETFRLMQENVEEEGNRPSDLAYLKKAKAVIDFAKKSKHDLQELVKVNLTNFSAMTSLANKYKNMLTSLDTSIQRRIDGFHFFMPVQSQSRIIQNAYVIGLQNDITKIKASSLEILIRKIGSGYYYSFYKILAFTVPQSDIIEEGQMYNADLLLINTKYYQPFLKIILIGNDMKLIREAGMNHLSFPAHATKFDGNGECRKTWKVAILKETYDTTYFFEKEYTVKKKQQ